MTARETILGPAVEGAGAAARPYAPSWVNVVTAWIDRLPGPAWTAHGLAIAGGILIQYVFVSLGGTGRVLEFTAAFAYYGALLPASVWLIHALDHVARGALAALAPSLDASPEQVRRWEYELTVIPARPAAIVTIATFALMAVTYASDPVAADIVGYSPVALVMRGLWEGTIGALALVLIYHSIRQLRLVDAIHRHVVRIELLQPGPLYAFSRLTSGTAIGIILLQVPGLLFIQASGVALWAAWLIPVLLIAAAIFVLPLRGMHAQFDEEKDRLQGEVSRRLRVTTDAIHLAVDEGRHAEADGLNKTLASLITERDLVAKLPTWPWAAGTFLAFASATALPIALWFVTRLLERVV